MASKRDVSSRAARGREARDPAAVLDECIARYLGNDVKVTNVVSALSKSFTECFLRFCEHGGDEENYVALFSRSAVKKLHNMYGCNGVRDVLTQIATRLDEISRGLQNICLAVYQLRLEVVTRTSVDTREPLLPLEISLSWDPVLNIPYIPSSTLKGVVRSYFELNNIVVDNLKPSDLFGDKESVGLVDIIDAYPIQCRESLVEPEVLTPHYSEAEKNLEEVYVRPTPIVYPVIAPGTVFITILCFNEQSLDKELRPATINNIVNHISKALAKGIGAKTTLGYGKMRVTTTAIHTKTS